MKDTKSEELQRYMPSRIRMILSSLAERIGTDTESEIITEEIRLRCNAPLTVGICGESCFVTAEGGMTNYEDNAYKVSAEEVREAFGKICENSVYTYLDEIRRGYITLDGGHRVGICGKAVCEKGAIAAISEVSSLNFRIAHEIIGIADGIIDKIINGSDVESTLIIAKPQMGKTTLLRDVIRQVSDRGFKCGVADDRGELAAMHKGIPGNRIGAQTDVIDSAPKAAAVEMLLRTMSPKVIATDEIANKEEADALLLAAGTGVRVIATAHGDGAEDACRRPIIANLLKEKVFKQAIVLKRDFSTPDCVTYTKAVRL